MRNTGTLYANDARLARASWLYRCSNMSDGAFFVDSAERLKSVRANLARLGVKNR